MQYVPEPIPAEYSPEYLERELRRIEASLENLYAGEHAKVYVAPDKLEDGMVRYADGTEWDPGSGEGVYIYNGTSWVPQFVPSAVWEYRVFAPSFGIDIGIQPTSAYHSNYGRAPVMHYVSGGWVGGWTPPFILPDSSKTYYIDVRGVMETAESNKNIRLAANVYFMPVAGDWSQTPGTLWIENGVDDNISVPDNNTDLLTHVGVNMKIPAADLTEDNPYVIISLLRGNATTNNHGGGFLLVDLLVREET